MILLILRTFLTRIFYNECHINFKSRSPFFFILLKTQWIKNNKKTKKNHICYFFWATTAINGKLKILVETWEMYCWEKSFNSIWVYKKKKQNKIQSLKVFKKKGNKRNKNSKHSFKYSRFICLFNKNICLKLCFKWIAFYSHFRVFCLYAFNLSILFTLFLSLY